MTETTIPALSTDVSASTSSLWKAGAASAVAAAAVVVGVAAAAKGLDVPHTIGGEEIPLLGFGQMVLMCTVPGVLVAMVVKAKAARARATWTKVAVLLTALSCVPSVAADATTATRTLLVTTHLVAAAIIIPAIARVLPERR